MPPTDAAAPLALAERSCSSLDTVRHTDLLSLCRGLSDASIDMILCDLPYGTTACSWDTVIPFAPMWAAFKRVIKPRGAIVLTASQPFTSALVMSNPGMFRYEWVWDKVRQTGFLDAMRKPLKRHESILVFSSGAANYFPIIEAGKPYKAKRRGQAAVYSAHTRMSGENKGVRFPTSIIRLSMAESERAIHQTAKPVALFEYLIRTYTQPGDVVLDPCVGSGTTAVACRNLDRRYICGDSSAEYVAVARKRLQDTDPYQATALPNGAIQHSLWEGLA